MNPAPPLRHCVYILRGKKNGKFYIGCTSNIEKRMKEHNEGKNYYTRRMLPVEIIYAEVYKSKKDAYEREKKLKHHGSALRNLKLRIKDTINTNALNKVSLRVKQSRGCHSCESRNPVKRLDSVSSTE